MQYFDECTYDLLPFLIKNINKTNRMQNTIIQNVNIIYSFIYISIYHYFNVQDMKQERQKEKYLTVFVLFHS